MTSAEPMLLTKTELAGLRQAFKKLGDAACRGCLCTTRSGCDYWDAMVREANMQKLLSIISERDELKDEIERLKNETKRSKP